LFRVIGIALTLLSLALIAVPKFTDCESQGQAIQSTSGEEVPMKCHWTGIAEIGVAIPMYIVGAVMAATRRRRTLSFLSLLGIALGGLAIAFPTKLIGVCPNPAMLCSTVMRPVLILLGSGAVGLSGLGLGLSLAKKSTGTSLMPFLMTTKKVTVCKGV
jgi:hypothetical protein